MLVLGRGRSRQGLCALEPKPQETSAGGSTGLDRSDQTKKTRQIMQNIARYNLKPDKESDFRQWLLDNRAAWVENTADGWRYLGTWFTVMRFGQYGCETRCEVDDYAALGAGFGNETSQRLLKEWLAFQDLARDSETYLVKNAEKVDILGG